MEKRRYIYFLGIGGIGMSALARYYHRRGVAVAGYDRTPSPLTRQLEAEGIAIHYTDNPALLPAVVEKAVYTPAVPKDSREWRQLEESGVPMVKRAVLLGEISRSHRCIALAGTHGKTSMTTLTALLCSARQPVVAFIGGVANNFHSNLLDEENAQLMVVEADEFDRSFLQLYPDVAVVSAMDADHLDIYRDEAHLREAFDQFSQQIRPGGVLFTKPSLRTGFHTLAEVRTYALHDRAADYCASNIRITEAGSLFDLNTPDGVIRDLLLSTAGLYNVENAVAAAAVALHEGVGEGLLRERLACYQGVKRRFEYIIRRPDLVYIDDYAHHPNELKACIESARQWHAGRRLCGVFQPHLYSRTRDFADEFAMQLSKLDEVVLLDIYPAREKPIEGVNSQMLLDKISLKNKYLCTKEELIPLLRKLRPELLLTMGAGDIDRLVEQIKNAL